MHLLLIAALRSLFPNPLVKKELLLWGCFTVLSSMDSLCCNHLQIFWPILIIHLSYWYLNHWLPFPFRAAVIPVHFSIDGNDLSEPSPLSCLTCYLSSTPFSVLHLSLLFSHTPSGSITYTAVWQIDWSVPWEETKDKVIVFIQAKDGLT